MSGPLPPASVPLAPPPPGQVSNFNDPDTSRKSELEAAIGICTTFALLCVLARVYTRIWLVKSFGWDDGLAVLAMALNILLMVSIGFEIKYGLTLLDWDVSLREWTINNYNGWLRWNTITYTSYIIAFATVKMSVLCLYLRIIKQTNLKTRIGVYIIMVYVMGVLIFGIATTFTLCDPPAKLFDVLDVPGTCTINKDYFFEQAIFQIFSDLLILIPPIPLVWGLQLSNLKKLGFIAILCIGFFVTAISITRAVFLAPGQAVLTLSGNYPGDLWGVLEMNFAIMAVCLPALSQFFIRMSGLWSSLRSNTIELASRIRNSPARSSPRNARSSTSQGVDGAYAEMGIGQMQHPPMMAVAKSADADSHEENVSVAATKRNNSSSGGSGGSNPFAGANATKRWYEEENQEKGQSRADIPRTAKPDSESSGPEPEAEAEKKVGTSPV